MSLSKRTRFEVFKRDAFTCLYCGRKPPEVILEVDHLIASANGGTDQMINLVTSCWDCNRGKGARPVDQVPEPHLENIEQRREKLEQMRALAEVTIEDAKLQDQMWETVSDHWMKLQGEDPDEWQLAGRFGAAVRKFLKLLPLEEVLDAVDVAFRNKNGNEKYFCGVCWRKIRIRRGEEPAIKT